MPETADGWEAYSETQDCEVESAEQVEAAERVEEAEQVKEAEQVEVAERVEETELAVQDSGHASGDLDEADAVGELETILPQPECDDGNDIPWDGCTDGKITEFAMGNGPAGQNMSFLDAAAVAGGGLALTWTQNAQSDGCDETDIYVRVFDAAGSPVTEAVELDDYEDGWSIGSRATALDELHALVAWTSYPDYPLTDWCDPVGPDGDKAGVFARAVDLLTGEVGPEWQVNQDGQDWQEAEAAVASTGSSAWVVWREWYTLATSDDDYAVRLIGREVSSEGPEPGTFQIDGGCGIQMKDALGFYGAPDSTAAVLSDANVAVVWLTNVTTVHGCEENSDCGALLVGRVFLPDGTPVTEEFLIPTPNGACVYPGYWGGTTALADGGLAVVYTGYHAPTSQDHVYLASVGPLGEPTGTIVQVDSADSIPLFPLVASLAGGNCGVAWNDYYQGSGYPTVMHRIHMSDGAFVGPESPVVSCPPEECFVGTHELIALDSGELMVLWIAWGSGGVDSIYAQRFGPDGKKRYH